jgi:hypothetical protein
MILDQLWHQALMGMAGGMMLELLHWYRLTRKFPNKQFIRSGIYWVSTVSMWGLGAVTPILYSSGSASALLCFHLGASAPLLLQKLATTTPALVTAQSSTGFSFRDFCEW